MSDQSPMIEGNICTKVVTVSEWDELKHVSDTPLTSFDNNLCNIQQNSRYLQSLRDKQKLIDELGGRVREGLSAKI